MQNALHKRAPYEDVANSLVKKRPKTTEASVHQWKTLPNHTVSMNHSVGWLGFIKRVVFCHLSNWCNFVKQ